jgi:hypothetical protein
LEAGEGPGVTSPEEDVDGSCDVETALDVKGYLAVSDFLPSALKFLEAARILSSMSVSSERSWAMY